MKKFPMFSRFKYFQFAALSLSVVMLIACEQKKTVEEMLTNVDTYLAEGKMNAAKIELKNVIKQDPDNYAARLQLADVYLQLGLYRFAEKEYRHYLAHNPSEKIKLSLAEALISQEKFEEAKIMIDDIAISNDRSPVNKHRLIEVTAAIKNGLLNYDDAKKILLADTENKSVYKFKELCKSEIGLGDIQQANKYATEAIKISDLDEEAKFLLGKTEFLLNQYDEAIKQFSQLLEIEQNYKNAYHLFNARLWRTRAYLIQQKYSEAKNELQLLENSAPKHPVVNYLQGSLAYIEGDISLASSYLYQSVSSDSSYGPSLYLLGIIKYAQKLPRQSQDYLSKYLRHYNDPAAQKLLAKLKIEGGNVTTLDELIKYSNDAVDSPEILRLLSLEAFKKGDREKGGQYLSKSVERGANSATDLVQSALIYFMSNDATSAVKILENLSLSKVPPYLREQLLVESYLQKNDLRAIRELQGVVKQSNIKPTEKYILIGDIYSRLDDFINANNAYKEALRHGSDDISVLLRLANLESIIGSTAKAHRILDDINKIDPNHLEANLFRANLFINSNLREKALTSIQKFEKSSKFDAVQYSSVLRFLLSNQFFLEAELLAEQAFVSFPNDQRILYELSQTKLLLNKFTEARKHAARLMELVPGDARFKLQLARVDIADGKYDTARLNLKKLLIEEPDSMEAALLLAEMEELDGNIADAINIIKHQQVANENRVEPYIYEANIYINNGKYANAEEVYVLANTKIPNKLWAYKRSELLAKSKNDQPELPLVDWLAAHPQDREIMSALGQTYLAQERYDIAAKTFEKFLQNERSYTYRDQLYVDVLNNLAWCYTKLEDARSVEVARKAYQMRPEDPTISDTLGWALVKQGKFSEAETYLLQALKDMPNEPNILYHYASMLAAKGDAKHAQQVLEEMLAENSEFSSRSEAEVLYKSIL